MTLIFRYDRGTEVGSRRNSMPNI